MLLLGSEIIPFEIGTPWAGRDTRFDAPSSSFSFAFSISVHRCCTSSASALLDSLPFFRTFTIAFPMPKS